MPEESIDHIDFNELNKKAISQPLVSHIYTADPSAHFFNGKIYIYPSHDVDAGEAFDDLGSHFAMEDYHVLSMDTIASKAVDHGVALHVKDVTWAEQQMWAPDAAEKNGTYYLYFPAKAYDGIFRIGVATSKSPTGPNQQDLKDRFELEQPFDLQESGLDALVAWQEHILVHLDKPKLTENQPLFFKAYTLTGPDKIRATKSKVLKLELLNSDKEILAVQYHKITEGMAEGAFNVPKKLSEGNYTLRAYTRWLQNYGEAFYFSTDLTLGNPEVIANGSAVDDLLVVSFHPEGGNLIGDLKNRLLIKAVGANGMPVDLTGTIIDSAGKKIMPIVPFGEGVMSVIFTPDSKERYRLKTASGAVYQLPNIISDGFLLNVNNLNSKTMNVRVERKLTSKNSKVWLEGSLDGTSYFKKELDLSKEINDVEISKEDIPSGIMNVSLVNESQDVLANRPVSIDALNTLNMSITPVTKGQKDNELVFKVKVTDYKGEPLATTISLSAVNATENKSLGFMKESAGFSWQQDNGVGEGEQNSARKERFIRDLRLMTLEEIGKPMLRYPQKVNYPFQRGLDLFGYVYDLDNELVRNAKIQMINALGDDKIVSEFETDINGKIRIEGLDLSGENELVFLASDEQGISKMVKIIPFQEQFEQANKSKSVFVTDVNKLKDRVTSSPWKPVDFDMLDNTLVLKELEIIDKNLHKNSPTYSLYGMLPERTIIQDQEKPKTIPGLFLGIPGVWLEEMGGTDPKLRLSRAAGGGSGFWVLDGVPMLRSSLVDIIDLVNFKDVERIEILYRNQAAALFGSRAAGGAILVYTNGGMHHVKKEERRFAFQGYNETPAFENFAAQIAKKPKKFEDDITTLFWNPSIQTDENGEAIVRFNTPFVYKQLEIKASAVTENGKVGSARITL